ncbi:type IV pilus twitching motility protein PilT [Pseudomonas sp. NPDC096950]|uniref:type IV pilus twitching motility protein PilT n=1 Tax=Pseudomonas sp. NPDC096950 TaxID=3364485 RepID=UPI00383A9056
MQISELLSFAIKNGASDLHISAGMPPMLRIDGDITKINLPALNQAEARDLVVEVMDDAQRALFEKSLELDLSYASEGNRFRVNAFTQSRGVSAVFRIIPEGILTLGQLGLGDVFKDIAETPKGLVLITGPTGSGKSTTLAALIDYLNATKPYHIVSVEDPIEFVHTSKMSLINQRELNRDTLSFHAALRSSLREDPDVIMVGELRDLETIRLALTAAETGHLVFGTLHTSSAAKTIDRIIDVFPADEKQAVRSILSESLQAVVAQVLVKKIGGGRVAAHEIMLCTPAVRNLIREGKVAQIYSTIQTGSNVGMQTLQMGLTALVTAGKVSKATADSVLGNADNQGGGVRT